MVGGASRCLMPVNANDFLWRRRAARWPPPRLTVLNLNNSGHVSSSGTPPGAAMFSFLLCNPTGASDDGTIQGLFVFLTMKNPNHFNGRGLDCKNPFLKTFDSVLFCQSFIYMCS